MSILSKYKEKDKTNLWAGICLMGAFCFMLFLYAPLELFFYNQRDFWFDVYTLLPLLLVLFAVSFLLSAAVMTFLFLVCEKLYYIVLPFASIAFLCTYVQGNILVGKLPPMDGTEYDWADYSEGRLPSIILWIVVTIVVLVALKLIRRNKFCKVVKMVSVFVVLMLSLTAVSICITTKGYRRSLDACATTKNEFVFSEDTNFIVLMVDAADSQTLYEMMEQDPEYKELFEDFTYYHNMMGAYPCTASAVPQILSGEWFENETEFDEYRAAAYKNSPLLENLEQKGYTLGMYEYEMPYLDESVFRFENVLERESKVTSYWNLAKLEIKLVGLRYAPFDLKKLCSFKVVEFSNTQETDSEYPIYLPGKKSFYDRIENAEVSLAQEKYFKFTHIDGAHMPFVLDKDLNDIQGGDYEDGMAASLTTVKAYLEMLKDAGLYDNSVIIVMADHGLDGVYFEEYTGRQNPMFLVKGVNEHHDMTVSEAPVSYVDLQEAFARLLEGANSSEIFDYQEGDQRERRYLYYRYEDEDHLYEYIQKEHASNDEMIATGETYFRGE